MGDLLSPEMLAAADDLFHMRIPQKWRSLAADTAPPANYSLANWLTDLSNRCQHFERILVLVSTYITCDGSARSYSNPTAAALKYPLVKKQYLYH